MFHTGLHDEYHRPSDVAKLINSAGMTRVTRLLFGVVYELAERPAAPGFRAAARHETPETEKAILDQIAKPADRLGVGWIEDAAVAGGVVVSTGCRPARRPTGPACAWATASCGSPAATSAATTISSRAVAAADSPAVADRQATGREEAAGVDGRRLPGSPLRWGIVWRVDDAEPGAVILTHVVPGSPAARAGPGRRRPHLSGRRPRLRRRGRLCPASQATSVPLQLLVERDGRLRTVVLPLPQAEPVRRAA